MAKQAETEKVTRGSGNVFRDLGFETADEMLTKANLVFAISRVMRDKRMTQVKLARAIGIDQPAVSKLLRGHTQGYTTDRLLRILNHLGQDVEIAVRPAKNKVAKTGKVFVVPPAITIKYAASKADANAVPVHVVKEAKARYDAKNFKKK